MVHDFTSLRLNRSKCPRPDLNRHDLAIEGFSYHFGFRRRPRLATFVVWSTPSPWPFGFRCPPSALYAFPSAPLSDGLGSVSTRPIGGQVRAFADFDGCHPEGFPSGAQWVQVPCVYLFHHSGDGSSRQDGPYAWCAERHCLHVCSGRDAPSHFARSGTFGKGLVLA